TEHGARRSAAAQPAIENDHPADTNDGAERQREVLCTPHHTAEANGAGLRVLVHGNKSALQKKDYPFRIATPQTVFRDVLEPLIGRILTNSAKDTAVTDLVADS